MISSASEEMVKIVLDSAGSEEASGFTTVFLCVKIIFLFENEFESILVA